MQIVAQSVDYYLKQLGMTNDTCNSTDKTQRHFAERKNLDTKECGERTQK